MNNQVIVGILHLEDHPTEPKLKIGKIDGHTVVVGDHYDQDTPGFFIPENAIIPDKLAEEMWVKGKLASKQKNRVKARTIGGVFSEGLFYGAYYWVDSKPPMKVDSPSWNHNWKVGDIITEEVGITFKVEK